MFSNQSVPNPRLDPGKRKTSETYPCLCRSQSRWGDQQEANHGGLQNRMKLERGIQAKGPGGQMKKLVVEGFVEKDLCLALKNCYI